MKEVHLWVIDLDKPTTGKEHDMFRDLEYVYELALQASGFKVESVFLRAVEGLPVTVNSPTGEIRFSE